MVDLTIVIDGIFVASRSVPCRLGRSRSRGPDAFVRVGFGRLLIGGSYDECWHLQVYVRGHMVVFYDPLCGFGSFGVVSHGQRPRHAGALGPLPLGPFLFAPGGFGGDLRR